MRKLTTHIILVIDLINDKIGKSISWLTLLMVLVTFGIVIMRYVFNEGSIAIQESVMYMHALVFMLGAAYTLKQDGHVRVDIFYNKMSPRKKSVVNFFGYLLLLLPVCVFIFWSSWEYVTDAWRVKESSREAGGLPWVYMLKASILAMAALLILQAVAEMLRNLLTIFGTSSHPPLEN
ncbi:MAG TPA: TRAP transporter small permease subunit [Gammaproteobacteria bacterium]|nr:TRAP transporter small permease subunit [Gammaproteobacteria bacterium]